ncbi:MAG: cytochrome P450 [Planctomycetota bacterium]|nr:MAG: cytochrome P450 [Planctomycetota bacterium]
MSDFPTLRLASPLPPIMHGTLGEFVDDPIHVMRQMWASHGEVAALQDDNHRIHFVFGPQYNHEVLGDTRKFHAQFFAVRGPRKSAQRRVTSGLLSMNGDQHREHRRTVQAPFQKKAVQAYHDQVIGVTQDQLASWNPGETKDIAEEMTHYMLRLTSSLLFGMDIPEMAYEVGRLTERWVDLNHQVGPAVFSADPALLANYEELLQAADELEQAVLEMVRMRRGGQLGMDVLSLLIRAHDMQGGVSDEQLVGHIVLLFGAAHLTSAHTLTWTLFLLAQHPGVMSQLHAEFQEKLDGQAPTAEQVDQLPFLDAVLRESMRVLPASAYSIRVAAETCELGPFKLNPGNPVIFSQFITHHMPHLFPQPEKFLPDRWGAISPSPYAYLPFGAGARMCIGAALAMMQFKISLPTMLGKFKLSMAPEAEVRARVMSTMLYPASSVPMRIERQDGHFTSQPVSGNIHTLVDLPPSTVAIRRAA